MADDGGLSRLQQRLEAIPRDVKKAVEPTLMKQAGNIVDTMERLVPDDPATNAPDLKSSIAITGPGQRTPAYSQPGGSMTVPENAVAITVGDADVRYPRLQEYGTTFHPAQPFFWPSFRLHRKKATSAIKSAVRRAVKKNWGS